MSNLVIYGSSSGKTGTTWNILNSICEQLPATVVDLSDYSISYFDYKHLNQDDGFQDVAKLMLGAKNIIFATPVYWHALSAQLKTFIDRLNDLTTLRKDWGRQLKGKQTALFITGYQDTLPEGFDAPIKEISRYFNMHYAGHVYISSQHYEPKDTTETAAKFLDFFNLN